MTTKQPEALRLADALDNLQYQIYDLPEPKQAAAQLRTQHALLTQAREALKYHVEQTRPIHRTTETLAALNQHLEPK